MSGPRWAAAMAIAVAAFLLRLVLLPVDVLLGVVDLPRRAWTACRSRRAPEAKGTPILNLFEPNDGPLLRISETMFGRDLLTLDVHDGRLVAEYDPADLNEAAQMFADELARVAQAIVTGRTLAIIGPRREPAHKAELIAALLDSGTRADTAENTVARVRKVVDSQPCTCMRPEVYGHQNHCPAVSAVVVAVRRALEVPIGPASSRETLL